MLLYKLFAGILKISKKIANKNINGLTINSKKVKKNFIFIACPGATKNSKDGFFFINNAIENGAYIIIGQKEAKNFAVPYIKVNNSKIIAAKLAQRFWMKNFNKIKLCGITGTNGKTSVSFLSAYILKKMSYNPEILGTLGVGFDDNLKSTGFTTPEAEKLSQLINQISQKKSHLFIEISSHALSTYRVDGLQFNIAAFTNLSIDHLDFHLNFKNYKNAKFRLFKKLLPPQKTAILPFGHKLCKILKNRNKIITWGKNPKSDIYGQLIEQNIDGIKANLCINNKYKNLTSNLIGEFQFENILCAAAIATSFGANLEQIVNGLNDVKNIPGRMQKININTNKKTPIIIVDFAHTPDALKKVLEALKTIGNIKKLLIVFGCGGNRDKIKRPIMGNIAQNLADKIFLTNDNPRDESAEEIIQQIVNGFNLKKKKNWKIIANREKAIKNAISQATPNDIVLILGKGSENTQEIKGIKRKFKDSDVAKKALMEFYS